MRAFRFLFSARLTWLLAAAFLSPVVARAATPTEYDLKAAFVFNFVRFIEWPPQALPPGHEPIVIGILGENPFGEALDAIVKGETINGHAVAVRRMQLRDDLTKCSVLYICRSETSHLGAVLDVVKAHPVVTVSDIDRFAYRGGMIGLVMEQGRVKIQINLDSAMAGQLTISAKLLRPALVIRTPPQSMFPPPGPGRARSYAWFSRFPKTKV